jgi:hypothetical protein
VRLVVVALSNWSGDAGPFCFAVEKAALCCSPWAVCRRVDLQLVGYASRRPQIPPPGD